MKSLSPYNHVYYFEEQKDTERDTIDKLVAQHLNRKTVVIQGLGFVGAAMLAVVAAARDSEGSPLYNVIGVDLPDEKNYWKIGMVNEFIPPVASSDAQLAGIYSDAGKRGNIYATYSDYAYEVADIVIVDIHLDIVKRSIGDIDNVDFSYDSFSKAMTTVAQKIKPGTLVIIETTVPPGTTAKIVYPLFKETFSDRGIGPDEFFLAHSYERVMPGVNYVSSINNFYRVYSGVNELSKQRAKEFLETIINIKDYPLSELKSTNASELAKVLENSYRAANIAFIQEWTEFADVCGVDLFEVVSAIRKRPTHSNIMLPGFGVGGYCLTKDALLADWAYRNNFSGTKRLEYSTMAIHTNDLMPGYTFSLMKRHFRTLEGVRIAILGVSYLKDVGDTRYSPTEYFYNLCLTENADIYLHDPMIEIWKEANREVSQDLGFFSEMKIKIVVFTVQHDDYRRIKFIDFALYFPDVELVIDANNVLSDHLAAEIRESGIMILGVGKGHWTHLRELK